MYRYQTHILDRACPRIDELLWELLQERACSRMMGFASKLVPTQTTHVLNTTRVMPRAAYQRLLLESLHATDRWETQPAVGRSMDRLGSREIVVTLEEAICRGRSEDPGTRDAMGILRGLPAGAGRYELAQG